MEGLRSAGSRWEDKLPFTNHRKHQVRPRSASGKKALAHVTFLLGDFQFSRRDHASSILSVSPFYAAATQHAA